MVKDKLQSVPGGDVFADVPGDLERTARAVASTYQPPRPSDEFRDALHARLVGEAARLQSEPAAVRPRFLVPAAVGAAAVAGVAVLAWRTRAIAGLVAHAQGQLRAAQGS